MPLQAKRNVTLWAIVAVVAVLVVAALCGVLISAMDTVGRPVACATYEDSTGVWREEDGEPFDDDPCDLDDLFDAPAPKVSKPPVTRTTGATLPKASKR